MSVPAETLRTQLHYTAWASARLVEAASQLTEKELTHDFGTADKSVLGTLVHTFAADRVWIHRVMGTATGPFLDPAKDMHLSVLQNDWPMVLERWGRWASELDDAAAKTEISYTALDGKAFTSPVWQIVLHVVNHATHHRGQAAGMMRTMGHPPPSLDMIRYYRTL